MDRSGGQGIRRAVGSVALAASLLTVAACGSTLQVPGSGGTASLGGSSAGDDGLTYPTSPAGQAGVGAQALGTSQSGGLAAVSPSGTAASSSSPGLTPSGQGSAASSAQPGGATTSSPASVVGVTAKEISIGIVTADGFDSVANSLGINVAIGSTHAEAAAVVDYLNAHGGMAGRRIVPVYYDVNAAEAATNHSAEEQAACTALTQDNHVYAVASAIGWGDTPFYRCLRQAGVISSVSGEAFDQQFFASDADYFYMPVEINMTRVMNDNIDALAQAGFFTGWNTLLGKPGPLPVKVGIIRNDTPSDLSVVDNSVKPALARHGLTLAADFALSGDTSQQAAQFAAAVLRFKADGITHVLFTFASPLLFMESAQTQDYHPRYGLQSRNSPGAELEANVSSSQLQGSMGMGWQQYNDVDAAHDPGPPSPRARLCLQLLRRAGQSTSSRATALVGLWYCDTLFFLHDALAAAPNLTPAGFREGAESLRHFDAASTFRSGFVPGGLHDGARDYRLFAYLDSCHCFSYVSGLRVAS